MFSRLIASLLAAVLLAAAPFATASAASLIYTLTPTSGSYQPGSTIAVTFGFTSSIEIAGASAHVEYSNSSLVSFESLGPSGFVFVDYNTSQNDVVFICENNKCAPGQYSIAKLHIKLGESGTSKITITNREAANPSLQKIDADGTEASFTINPAAPSTPPSTSGNTNTSTVPSGQGSGRPGAIVPGQINQGELSDQQQAANDEITGLQFQQQLQAQGIDLESGKKKSGTSPVLWILIGFAGGILLVFGVRWLIRFLRLRRMNKINKALHEQTISDPSKGPETGVLERTTVIRPTEYPSEDQEQKQ